MYRVCYSAKEKFKSSLKMYGKSRALIWAVQGMEAKNEAGSCNPDTMIIIPVVKGVLGPWRGT